MKKIKMLGLLKFLAVFGCGFLGFVALVGSRELPGHKEVAEKEQAVRTVLPLRQKLRPVVRAYGSLQAVAVQSVIPELSGRVLEINSALAEGNILQAGDFLLQIDPADVLLAKKGAEASFSQIEARLAEVEQTRQNLQLSAKLEKENLAIVRQEKERMSGLFAGGSVTEADLDRANAAFLQAQNKLLQVENQLRLLPTTINNLQAQKKQAQAKLAESELHLSRSKLFMPFRGRVGEFRLQPGQYIRAGQELFRVSGTGKYEIPVGLTMGQLSLITGGKKPVSREVDKAELVLRNGDFSQHLPAELRRFSDGFDEKTRTIKAIVELTDNSDHELLRPGIFAEVLLFAKEAEEQLIVPLEAVENNRLRFVDKEGRLQFLPVQTDWTLADMAVLAPAELPTGAAVLLSVVYPEVAGLKIKSVADEKRAEDLQNFVKGKNLLFREGADHD
jgi:multidrug efflux pump subunit AcrA (membrane-fusion protein)